MFCFCPNFLPIMLLRWQEPYIVLECEYELKICISRCVKLYFYLVSVVSPCTPENCPPTGSSVVHHHLPFFFLFNPNQSIARSSQAIRWMPFTRLPSPTPLCPTGLKTSGCGGGGRDTLKDAATEDSSRSRSRLHLRKVEQVVITAQGVHAR